MRTLRTFLIYLPLALAASLGGVACGGDDDDTPADAATGAPDGGGGGADAAGTADAGPVGPTGTLQASWTITKGGQPSSCEEVGAATLRLTTTPAAGSPMTTDWPCAPLMGTATVPAGTSTFVVDVRDQAGTVLGMTQPVSGDVPEGQTVMLQIELPFP